MFILSLTLRTTLNKYYCSNFMDEGNRFHKSLYDLLEDSQLIGNRARCLNPSLWFYFKVYELSILWCFPIMHKKKKKEKKGKNKGMVWRNSKKDKLLFSLRGLENTQGEGRQIEEGRGNKELRHHWLLLKCFGGLKPGT